MVIQAVFFNLSDIVLGLWHYVQAVGIAGGVLLATTLALWVAAGTFGKARGAHDRAREAARKTTGAKGIPIWISVFVTACGLVVSFFVAKGIMPETASWLSWVTGVVVAGLTASLFIITEGALLGAAHRARVVPKERLVGLFLLGVTVATITGFLSLSALLSLVGQNTRVESEQARLIAAQTAFLSKVKMGAEGVAADDSQDATLRRECREGLEAMEEGAELTAQKPARFTTIGEGAAKFNQGAAKVATFAGRKREAMMASLQFQGDQNSLELGAATLAAMVGKKLGGDGVNWGAAIASFLLMLALDFSVVVVALILMIKSGLGKGRIITIIRGPENEILTVVVDIGSDEGLDAEDVLDAIGGGSLIVTELMGEGACVCKVTGRKFEPAIGQLVSPVSG